MNRCKINRKTLYINSVLKTQNTILLNKKAIGIKCLSIIILIGCLVIAEYITDADILSAITFVCTILIITITIPIDKIS